MSKQPDLFGTPRADASPLPEGFGYERTFLAPADATATFTALLVEVPWKQEVVKAYGKTHDLPRLTAWFGDEDAYYRYSGIGNAPLAWTPRLQALRAQLQEGTGEAFNSVLLNRYRTGADSVSWHADDEAELGPHPFIASVSLGETRRFRLRHRTSRETISIDLEAGSLLTMGRGTQAEWQHCLPKSKRPLGERINLTFRWIDPSPE